VSHAYTVVVTRALTVDGRCCLQNAARALELQRKKEELEADRRAFVREYDAKLGGLQEVCTNPRVHARDHSAGDTCRWRVPRAGTVLCKARGLEARARAAPDGPRRSGTGACCEEGTAGPCLLLVCRGSY
jgi:hypothetical protein